MEGMDKDENEEEQFEDENEDEDEDKESETEEDEDAFLTNRIVKIPLKNFYKKKKEFDFNDIKFFSLSSNAFGVDFCRLKYVSFDRTRLEKFEKNAFQGLDKLKEIHIYSCNLLEKIEAGAFNGLCSLKKLFVNECKLPMAKMRSDTFEVGYDKTSRGLSRSS